MGQLHLGLEVADGAQTADDRGGATGAAEVDREPIEGDDLDCVRRDRGSRERVADQPDPRLDVEERRFPRVCEDATIDAIEDGGGPGHHVDMTVGDRVERAGVDRDRLHQSSSRR